MKMILKTMVCLAVAFSGTAGAANYSPEKSQASLALKVPGNPAVEYPLTLSKLSDSYFDYEWKAKEKIPVTIFQQISTVDDKQQVTVVLTAMEDVYFNFEERIRTDFRHDDCQFYLPGFWYRRNLRSPKEAPSFHTSDSWVVREDRLSTPLTGIFDEKQKKYMTVVRRAEYIQDALSTHKEGEVILSGTTSLGFTGFENLDGTAALAFGFPYKEAPKTYIRKLTLAPSVTAFQLLKKGESISLTWEIHEGKGEDFAEFVSHTWEYCYDTFQPKPVETDYTPDYTKEILSHFFIESFVGDRPLNYNSGVHMRTDDCQNTGSAEVGFVGRVLLNAFNAWEYGWKNNRADLKENAAKVFDTYLVNGFSPAGFFKEFVDYRTGYEETVFSIRRQSEGIYAIFHYLDFEKRNGRKHPEWEAKVRKMLDVFLQLQNPEGSFPRKFKDDLSIVDKSGGSTPSATLPLVMGYKYFKDKRYLESAKRTAEYLEKELISKSDYFSSTLDANCEDKEGPLYMRLQLLII